MESILASQNESGAWGAGDVDLVEATSDIIYYLKKDFPDEAILHKPIEESIRFVKSRYCEIGYFKSGALLDGEEHSMYSTFTSVRALKSINELTGMMELNIKHWIEDCRNSSDGLWGEMPKSQVSTIAHSIYALMTLDTLGCNVTEEYGEELNRLYKKILKSRNLCEYEEYSFEQVKEDKSGMTYKRIRINHFILPLAINFYATIGDLSKAKLLVKRLFNCQYDGRWGLSDSFHTVWATQQAIDAITKFDSFDKEFIYHLKCFWLWCRRNLLCILIGLLIFGLVVIVACDDGWGKTTASILVGTCTGVLANTLTALLKDEF